MSATYTVEEVAKHNTKTDCWIIVEGGVYDITEFLGEHPGGKKPLVSVAGKDATEQFMMLHKPSVLTKHGAEYKIGVIG